MIHVEEGAQKTNAYQENRNLLLSKTATANSIPGLEILANDVRCTHGATLSQVDREQLYLMARGLPRSTAERMIVRGFFQDVLDRIELRARARRRRRRTRSAHPGGLGPPPALCAGAVRVTEPDRGGLPHRIDRPAALPSAALQRIVWAQADRSAGTKLIRTEEKEMITTGQTLTNPATGETLVFRTTSADTNGECCRGRGVRRAERSRRCRARASVAGGALRGARRRAPVPSSATGRSSRSLGDAVLVPAGTPHRFENIGDDTAHFVCEVSPALGFEQLIETMFALAADGKVNRKGMPNPLRLAVIARHRFDDVRLPVPAGLAAAARARDGGAPRPAPRVPSHVRAHGAGGIRRPRRLSDAQPRGAAPILVRQAGSGRSRIPLEARAPRPEPCRV